MIVFEVSHLRDALPFLLFHLNQYLRRFQTHDIMFRHNLAQFPF